MALSPTPTPTPIHAKLTDDSDRSLSALPDELLLLILSLLPTRTAARTSVLSSRFRHLWKHCSSLDLLNKEDFLALTDRLLLRRDANAPPLLSVRLDFTCPCCFDPYSRSFVSSVLAKVCSFPLRSLSIQCTNKSCLFSALPAIFSITSLQSLSLPTISPPFYSMDFKVIGDPFPSAVSLPRLRTLSLGIHSVHAAHFHRLLSQLSCLQDLTINVCNMEKLIVASNTITKLKIVIVIVSSYNIDPKTVMLSLPSLEFLHIGHYGGYQQLPKFQGDGPLLIRKAVVNLEFLRKDDCNCVAGLLNYVSHVEELSLNLKEHPHEQHPFHILLEPGEDAPDFSNLKHLEATMCFHEHNTQDIVSMLHHSPALESLKLVHKEPDHYTFGANKRKRNEWISKLPGNADYNNRHAYFTNLHLGQNNKQYERLLNKISTPKSM